MSNSKIGYQAKVGYQVGDLVIVDNSSQRWCLVVLRRFVTTNRRTGSLLVQNTFFSTQDTSKEIYSTQQIYTMDYSHEFPSHSLEIECYSLGGV